MQESGGDDCLIRFLVAMVSQLCKDSQFSNRWLNLLPTSFQDREGSQMIKDTQRREHGHEQRWRNENRETKVTSMPSGKECLAPVTLFHFLIRNVLLCSWHVAWRGTSENRGGTEMKRCLRNRHDDDTIANSEIHASVMQVYSCTHDSIACSAFTGSVHRNGHVPLLSSMP